MIGIPLGCGGLRSTRQQVGFGCFCSKNWCVKMVWPILSLVINFCSATTVRSFQAIVVGLMFFGKRCWFWTQVDSQADRIWVVNPFPRVLNKNMNVGGGCDLPSWARVLAFSLPFIPTWPWTQQKIGWSPISSSIAWILGCFDWLHSSARRQLAERIRSLRW